MSNIAAAEKLLDDINQKLNNWNERSQFTIKGVKNLSRADLDDIELYAEQWIQNGGYGFSGLMNPCGGVKDVLDKYGLKNLSVYS